MGVEADEVGFGVPSSSAASSSPARAASKSKHSSASSSSSLIPSERKNASQCTRECFVFLLFPALIDFETLLRFTLCRRRRRRKKKGKKEKRWKKQRHGAPQGCSERSLSEMASIISAVQTRLKLEEATSAKDDVTPGANEERNGERHHHRGHRSTGARHFSLPFSLPTSSSSFLDLPLSLALTLVTPLPKTSPVNQYNPSLPRRRGRHSGPLHPRGRALRARLPPPQQARRKRPLERGRRGRCGEEEGAEAGDRDLLPWSL